ncbi:Ras-related protein Rab-8A, partial [Operophtera brumata]
MALDFSATYKLLVLGDSNVGKTCIVHRYCDERYYDIYISTIGIDFKQKIISLDGVPIKLQIWDTAGQERFRTLTTAYYRGAMGIILMYDITNLESFNHLSYWLRNIQEYLLSWGWSGQKRFSAYCRDAMGIILMYDVTNLESFNHLSYWLRNIQEYLLSWDWSGQKRFSSYCRDAMGIILMYDVNNLESFNHLSYWLRNIQEIADDFDMPFFE